MDLAYTFRYATFILVDYLQVYRLSSYGTVTRYNLCIDLEATYGHITMKSL
jgi:hypothetical protein